MRDESTNRLIGETSPYLHQHAHNPVDWYPWGDEALARARSEDRPILLSVGYSACHWCHVMAHESFEDEAIAALMNEHFVNIKVDREERPDLDEVYMAAVQAISGSGGWPMTVFLTPDLRPFYGGTYYPPEDRYGRPGFPRVLTAVSAHFREHREQVEEQASRLLPTLRASSDYLTTGQKLAADAMQVAAQSFADSFDEEYGGFGAAPKFPGSMGLLFLLRHHRRTGDAQALHMAHHTLQSMACGGLYDQLGGGFHRYSVDERWLVPHFEKMLYDNALLAWVYAEAYQLTGEALFRDTAAGTLDYVGREMERPGGGFFASQDADTEGEEGRYFVWRPEEIAEVLGEAEARLVCEYYGVTAEGNFEGGASVLHARRQVSDLAGELGMDVGEVSTTLAAARSILLERRRARVAPGLDDKIIAAWNGLMISAMARAAGPLERPEYLASAQSAARFLLQEMVVDDRLYHSLRQERLGAPAYQDDYAALIGGLLDLYEASLEAEWLDAARRLTRQMIDLFWDDDTGGFYYTEEGAADLIVRPRPVFDNATPSGNSLAALSLLRLAAMTGEADLRDRADCILDLYSGVLGQAPTACGLTLCAVDFAASAPVEAALVGPDPGRAALLRAVHTPYVPNKVVVGPRGGDGADLPLLTGKEADGDTALAYVCRDSVCAAPVRDAAAVTALLTDRGR